MHVGLQKFTLYQITKIYKNWRYRYCTYYKHRFSACNTVIKRSTDAERTYSLIILLIYRTKIKSDTLLREFFCVSRTKYKKVETIQKRSFYIAQETSMEN